MVLPDANIVNDDEFPTQIDGARKVSNKTSAHFDRSVTEDFNDCKKIENQTVSQSVRVSVSQSESQSVSWSVSV